MRPEPGHRPSRAEKRKAWNESPPVCIRIASHPIKDELDARSDGTLAGYRQVIVRDLMRYYEMCQHEAEYISMEWGPGAGLDLYHKWEKGELDRRFVTGDTGVWLATIDACERAKILTDAGLSLDEALTQVGLVASGEANG
jgi:hypothetical protein